MKRTLMFAALAAVLISGAGAVSAAGFTYHGSLQDAGKPANGRYDIELTLYSAQTGGSVIGGPLTMYAVPVQGGSFSTEADFGPLAKSFSQAYVGVKVRSAGKGDFATLDTRAAATVDAATGCPGSWDLLGNAGNPSGSFLGTTDAQPLALQTGGQRIVVTDLIGGGTVPRWIGGGSQNGSLMGQGSFIGGGGSSTSSAQRNQVGTFSVVAGGAQNSAGYTAATGYSTICGGNANTANVDYATIAGGSSNKITANDATIGGGDSNTASGGYAVIGGGLLNTASGVGATVPGGEGNTASGKYSLAAGTLASAGDNSFVWNDGNGLQYLVSTGSGQFDVGATGGMAINGTPKNSGIELSIYPSRANGGNFSNLFFGLSGQTAGILTSAGGASSATSNDASFFFDDYNGNNATQTRLFSVTPTGITVGLPTEIPATVSTGLVGLNLVHSPGANVATLDMFPAGSTAGYYELTAGTSEFRIARYVPNTSYTPVLDIAGNGDLTVSAAAFKPGGGSWSVSSDRRIKQDIVPIHDALDTVMKLRPVNFHYTPEYRAMEGGLADKSYAGFVAQEFADVFPEAVVSTGKHAPGTAKNDPTILALDPNPALITTVAAVQELAVENWELHKQVDALEARLSKLEAGKGH